jgi:hypothetical protein
VGSGRQRCHVVESWSGYGADLATGELFAAVVAGENGGGRCAARGVDATMWAPDGRVLAVARQTRLAGAS